MTAIAIATSRPGRPSRRPYRDAIRDARWRPVRIANWYERRTCGTLSGMSGRDEYCPLYRSLDLFGDRWGLLVVRELLRGVDRFNEMERSLPGISRSTLAQRLRHLE